jgi:hypothetical protein
LKRKFQILLGYIFYGIEFEELVLCSMARNCDMLGTVMFRYNEKQLYKKFLDVVRILSLGHLDSA